MESGRPLQLEFGCLALNPIQEHEFTALPLYHPDQAWLEYMNHWGINRDLQEGFLGCVSVENRSTEHCAAWTRAQIMSRFRQLETMWLQSFHTEVTGLQLIAQSRPQHEGAQNLSRDMYAMWQRVFNTDLRIRVAT